MADEQHKRAIIENSKAIKELTKSLSKSQGNTPPSEEKQRSESTGIKAVDNKIEDIKSAFSNNSTIKFFKDPVGSFGGGIKSVLSPFAELGNSFKDGFGKFGEFLSGKGKASKVEKQTLKHLKSIDDSLSGGGIFGRMTESAKEAFSLFGNQDVLGEAMGQATAKAIGGSKDSILGKSLKPILQIQAAAATAIPATLGAGINKLISTEKKIGAAGNETVGLLGGKIEKLIKSDTGIGRFASKFFGGESQLELVDENTQYLGSIARTQNAVTKEGFSKLTQGFNKLREQLLIAVTPDLFVKNLSDNIASALSAEEAKKDQKKSEQRKDDILRTHNANEQLLLALDDLGSDIGKGQGATAKKTSFSLVDFFKKALGGAGTVVGAKIAGVGAGISGFFKALGSGFMFMGANLPLFAKGAAALALMGASFIPFAGALYLINQALEGFTFKKIGMFATLLTTAGVAIAAFTAAVAFTGGGVFLGIAALAAAGAALIPFGYAMKLAGDGLKSAATLFAELGDVGWDKVSQAAPAMKDLAVAFRDLAFGGIIEKITGGGFGGFVQDLKDFGTESSAIVALADAMDRLKESVEPFKEMKFTTNIQDLLKTVASTGEQMEGGIFGTSFFGTNMKKASEGLGLFLAKITEHLNYNEGRGALMDSMSNLLDRSVAAQAAFSNNNTAALTGGMEVAGFGSAMQMPVIVNQGANVTNSNPVTHINQDFHLNNRTMEFFLDFKKSQ